MSASRSAIRACMAGNGSDGEYRASAGMHSVQCHFLSGDRRPTVQRPGEIGGSGGAGVRMPVPML